MDTLNPSSSPEHLTDASAAPRQARLLPSSLEHRCPASLWGLFGRSPRMQALVDRVAAAGARYDGVLVSGEPGTGRGLVARAVHESGVTRGQPFVAVYCRDIPPGEAEVELFGRPAAKSSHRERHSEMVTSGSLVHQALGGTLYFRNPEELPDRAQARLARLFRDREVLVDNLPRAERYEVRLVAAVGPEYQDHLAEGRVRVDLHRRLCVRAIEVPPLRDRVEDIPLLAEYFVEKACQGARIAAKALSQPAQALLSAMPWRGNARELQSLLGAVVLSVTRPAIGLEDLLTHIHLEAAAKSPFHQSGFEPTTLREARARFEREYVLAVLAQHRGRVPDAARVLGIQRTNLYRKLRALRIKRERGESQALGAGSAGA